MTQPRKVPRVTDRGHIDPSRNKALAIERRPVPPANRSFSASPQIKKKFVLDTNVLMHDPTSIFSFAEHDVYIPMMTLEELDNNKKGAMEQARNARQVSRFFDELVSSVTGDLNKGIPIVVKSGLSARGKIFFQTGSDVLTSPSFGSGKADNQIIAVTKELQKKYPTCGVVLVSKDINMRIKARALGIPAEDYFNDKVLDDMDLLYAGTRELPADFWDKHGKSIESWQEHGRTFYDVRGPLCSSLLVNEYVYHEEDKKPFYAVVTKQEGKTVTLKTLKDYTHQKNAVWGIVARNREQNFALNALMDPEIDFVTLLGQAGTGKTLLTLAAALEQTLEKKGGVYSDTIITRVTIPVGEDIGFLPGTEEEKMNPWMGAMEDNLDVLGAGGHHDGRKDGEKTASGDWENKATMDLIRSRLKVKSLNFMRGRTFLNKFLIIDEAQNLTPKQLKTLITRAGPGTKVVCLGNLAQIDTPYLTEGSSGLTYVVDRFKGWINGAHVTLLRGERSRLADHAAEVL